MSWREALWGNLRELAVLRHLYRVPFFRPGLTGISRWLVPTAARCVLSVESGLAEGVRLELSPRWELDLWRGTYEAEVQAVLARALHEDVVFYDVGANVGFFALGAALKGARVFAFEPDPANRDALERNLRLNGLDGRVAVMPTAVFSHARGVRLLPSDQRRAHGNAVVAERAQPAAVETDSVTLDEFALTHAAADVIKIDVEGAEVEVLHGARGLLQQRRPLLICEVHSQELGRTVEDALGGIGYSLQWLDHQRRWIAGAGTGWRGQW